MAGTYTSVRRNNRPSRRKKAPAGTRLLIIGNGMVGAKFCEALVENGLTEHLKISAVCGEPHLAYDRIRLSSYVSDRRSEKLLLKPATWYEDNHIKLHIGSQVSSIDRSRKLATLDDGSKLDFDLLVFATGSRPFVPPIPGHDLPGVFVYRTIADLEAIISAATGKLSAVVIGGGLLGLEAAQAVQALQLKASVVERAPFLMPQQLNQAASKLLQQTVEDQDIRLLLGKNSTVISSCDERLELTFDESESIQSDLVIISAGITPNSELAKDAGLHVGARGGIVVDRHMETEDPGIFAIGECALVDGRLYGLAAPGFAMARHLAARLAGERIRPLPEPDLSTRLKMLGTNVVIIGNPLEEGKRYEFISEGIYRLILTGPRGRLLGGLGVGPWEESGRILSLFKESALIRSTELDAFTQNGTLITKGQLDSVIHWPDHRIICNCMNISKGQITACLKQCGHDADKLASATEASTVCGSCRPLIDELCGQPPTSSKPIGARSLLTISILALIAVVITCLIPPVGMADSVESFRYKLDKLWRDNLIKQLTGYTLVGLFLVGLLLSPRKRLRWLRIGHFARWRVFHALFGLVSLIALFAHTGFRFGHNLNFWLMLTFVAINLLGAAAGIVSAIESNGTSSAALTARRFRPFLIWAHIVLFWPLPVLLTFHVLSVYLY